MTTRIFPGNFKSLEPISDYVIQEAQQIGFSPEEIYAIQTAVDEACSNIIDHAYEGENKGEIRIKIIEIDNGLKITLHDFGKPFDPGEVNEPDLISPLEMRKERGLGIFFIRQLMDKVIFKFTPSNGNKLTLIKFKGA
jgi:serine/threonine-protein kinase RsbW